MLRSVASKVAWVGRTASMVLGLALVLALVFGVASMALGANGDFFKIGRANIASAVSTLTKSGTGPALSLKVDRGAPLAVNSGTRVANLNADKLDGKEATNFLAANGTAPDSAKLGGEPAASYLRKCQDATVYGRAEINGANATSTLSTTGVNDNTDFICTGENVQVEREQTGSYEVVFGDVEHFGGIGLGSGNGPLPVVSARERGKVVNASGPFQCASTTPPSVICFQVEVRSLGGTAVDGNFNIAIM